MTKQSTDRQTDTTTIIINSSPPPLQRHRLHTTKTAIQLSQSFLMALEEFTAPKTERIAVLSLVLSRTTSVCSHHFHASSSSSSPLSTDPHHNHLHHYIGHKFFSLAPTFDTPHPPNHSPPLQPNKKFILLGTERIHRFSSASLVDS